MLRKKDDKLRFRAKKKQTISMRNLITLLITLIVTSCSKESENVSTLHNVSPSISGITMRDMNGNLIGTVDAFDWNANDLFPVVINSYFNFSDTLDYSGADTSTLNLFCYPNPFQQLVSLYINNSNPTICKLILTDETNTIYIQQSYNLLNGSNQLYFDLGDSSLHSNKLFRFYYKFYNEQKECYASGHGDLEKM